MSIEKTKNAKIQESYLNLHYKLDNVSKDTYFDTLPLEMKKKLSDFKNELENYKVTFNQSNYKIIDKEILNEDSILAIIVKASHYNKWSLSEKEELTKERIEDIKNEFGVSFNQEVIYQYFYYRPTHNRDDINLITVIALPGYNEVGISTDRAGLTLDNLLTPAEIEKNLKGEF